MEKLQKLIELAAARGHIFTYDLFNSHDYQEKRFAELTEQIHELAESLSIFDISENIPKVLTVQFSIKDIFTSISDAPVKSELVDEYIYHSKMVDVKIFNGQITKKLKLLYLENVEEHKKAQAI